MQSFVIILYVLVFIILMRLIFRKLIDLPNYSGRQIADSSEIDNIMSENEFWQIIETTRKQSGSNYMRQCQILTDLLEKMTSQEIIQFDRTFFVLLAKTYNFRLWEAAYALNGGCSDDGFEYFRSWLIGQGKNKFYWTFKYPRLLLLVGVKEIIERYEGLTLCAYQAYQNKIGLDIPKKEDIQYSEGGQMFKEGEAFLRYPELALLAW